MTDWFRRSFSLFAVVGLAAAWLASRPQTATALSVPAPHTPITLTPWVERDAVLANIRATFDEAKSVGIAIHYLRLSDVLPPGDPWLQRARDRLRGFDAAFAPIVATRSGARYLERAHKAAPLAEEESHVGQALAAFAEVGAPPSESILFDGRPGSLADIVADIAANCYAARFDLEWTAVALATYWPHSTWRDRFGDPCSFEAIATELLSRDAFLQSCGGSHVLQAMACLVSRRADALSHATLARLRSYLAEAMMGNPLGGDARRMRVVWRDGIPRLARDKGPSLLVGGHIVEFALTSWERLGERMPFDVSSIAWLAGELAHFATHPVPLEDFCAVTHAFRAVAIA
jgi:hypothetical protein